MIGPVRLIIGTKIIEERMMDRVPMVEEVVWVEEDLYIVKEVHWRNDGHASVLISKNCPKNEYFYKG